MSEWDTAYAYFNAKLFQGQLPRQVIFSVQRRTMKDGCWAYHTAHAYHRKGPNGEDYTADEIALNCTKLASIPAIEALAVLVHEMVHVWQDHVSMHKSKGKGDYHDRRWADKMIRIGLTPTQTGKAGGRQTGCGMHELVTPGGQFETFAQSYIDKGFWIWGPNPSMRIVF